MKKITRALALVTAVIMCLACMSLVSFGADATTGSLTITSASMLGTINVNAYRFLEYEDGSYKTNGLSNGFIGNETYNTGKYTADTLIATLQGSNDKTAAERSVLLKQIESYIRIATELAKTYLTTTSIPNGGSKTLNNMPFGYYIVINSEADKTSPSAAFLSPSQPNVDVYIKGSTVTVKKEIVDGDDTYTRKSYSVGDTVTFRITSKVPDLTPYVTAESGLGGEPQYFEFILNDDMNHGNTEQALEFIGIKSVMVGKQEFKQENNFVRGTTTDPYTYKYLKGDDLGTDKDKYDFEISLNSLYEDWKNNAPDERANTYDVDSPIVIEYTAKLTSNAVPATDYENYATITYSRNPDIPGRTFTTDPSTVEVYTYKFDFRKTTGIKNTNYLSGATFILKDTSHTNVVEADGKTYNQAVELMMTSSTDSGVTTYTYTPTGNYINATGVVDGIIQYEGYTPGTDTLIEIKSANSVTGKDSNGKDVTADAQYVITGLKAGTYALEEMTAPEGYQVKGNNGYHFTIVEDYDEKNETLRSITLDPQNDSENWVALTSYDSSTGTLQINVADAKDGEQVPELPSTGGIGTAVFTAGGLALMIIALGAFVFKKKAA